MQFSGFLILSLLSFSFPFFFVFAIWFAQSGTRLSDGRQRQSFYSIKIFTISSFISFYRRLFIYFEFLASMYVQDPADYLCGTDNGLISSISDK
jgi:hypothetical protein